jgi:hypothetical protein
MIELDVQPTPGTWPLEAGSIPAPAFTAAAIKPTSSRFAVVCLRMVVACTANGVEMRGSKVEFMDD